LKEYYRDQKEWSYYTYVWRVSKDVLCGVKNRVTISREIIKQCVFCERKRESEPNPGYCTVKCL